jgi:hypothetical protein
VRSASTLPQTSWTVCAHCHFEKLQIGVLKFCIHLPFSFQHPFQLSHLPRLLGKFNRHLISLLYLSIMPGLTWTCHCGNGPMMLPHNVKCSECDHVYEEGCCSTESVKDSEGFRVGQGFHGAQGPSNFASFDILPFETLNIILGRASALSQPDVLGLPRMSSQTAYLFQPAPDVISTMPSSSSVPATGDSPTEGEEVWSCCKCDQGSPSLSVHATTCHSCHHAKCGNCKVETTH